MDVGDARLWPTMTTCRKGTTREAPRRPAFLHSRLPPPLPAAAALLVLGWWGQEEKEAPPSLSQNKTHRFIGEELAQVGDGARLAALVPRGLPQVKPHQLGGQACGGGGAAAVAAAAWLSSSANGRNSAG